MVRTPIRHRSRTSSSAFCAATRRACEQRAGRPGSIPVELSAGLAADLARLTDALDDPATDLADLLGSLHEAFLVAVPSGLGLAMTIVVSPDEVTVSTLDGSAGRVATSLRVPLRGWTDLGPGS